MPPAIRPSPRPNAQASLGGVGAGALDEMFSQGEPVLAGVDVDSGYLFGLSLSATRDGDAWAELLREGQAQGLGLSVVVKDAAKGIAAGVSEVFPHAEQRDDCFHVLYEMNKVRRRLERRASNGESNRWSGVDQVNVLKVTADTCADVETRPWSGKVFGRLLVPALAGFLAVWVAMA